MKTVLVVTTPFADYAKGDHITDPAEMDRVQEHHHAHVVRAHLEDEAVVERAPPAPAAKKRATKPDAA